MLIKPGCSLSRDTRSISCSTARGAISSPASFITDPRKSSPRSTRPINVLSGCCSTFNSASVSLTIQTAARNFQRHGSGTGSFFPPQSKDLPNRSNHSLVVLPRNLCRSLSLRAGPPHAASSGSERKFRFNDKPSARLGKFSFQFSVFSFQGAVFRVQGAGCRILKSLLIRAIRFIRGSQSSHFLTRM